MAGLAGWLDGQVAVVTARACLPELIKRRGCVVAISSIAGLAAAPESVGCVTAKHGLIGLAKSMARDFGPPSRARSPRWWRSWPAGKPRR